MDFSVSVAQSQSVAVMVSVDIIFWTTLSLPPFLQPGSRPDLGHPWIESEHDRGILSLSRDRDCKVQVRYTLIKTVLQDGKDPSEGSLDHPVEDLKAPYNESIHCL